MAARKLEPKKKLVRRSIAVKRVASKKNTIKKRTPLKRKKPPVKRVIVRKRPMKKTSQQTRTDIAILQQIALDLSKSSLPTAISLFEIVRTISKNLTTSQQQKLQELALIICNMPVKVFSGKIRLEEGLAEMNKVVNHVVRITTPLKRKAATKSQALKVFNSLKKLQSYMPKVIKVVNDNFEGPVQKSFVKMANAMDKKLKTVTKTTKRKK